MKRIYQSVIHRFKPQKMLFITGPRQVGKTTLAQSLVHDNFLYLNWDIPEDRDKIVKIIFTEKVKCEHITIIILDEIHKYHRWKNQLKGLVDRKLPNLRIIVTGSAKLDYVQRSGDSMLGRYETLRLHPFSVGELVHGQFQPPPIDWLAVSCSSEYEKNAQEILQRLELLSGFPEPYLENDVHFYNRWTASRNQLLLTEDLSDISHLKLLSSIAEFGIVIPSRVGSLLSLNSLKEILGVSHDSVKTWLNLFDRIYFTYRIKSYSKQIHKGILKSEKLYLWNWAQVEDPGARRENLVAGHLLKNIHLWNDLGYGEFELNYVRDKNKNEIDFVVLNKRKPIVCIEVKSNHESLSPNWKKFEKNFSAIPKIQLISAPGIDRLTHAEIRIVSMSKFLGGLN